MNNSIDCPDKEISKRIDKSRIYSDIDGIFDCTLIKYADDNQKILNEIQITIIHESLKYSLLIHKSNDETSVDVSDSNIELVKSKFDLIFHNLTGNFWKYRDQFIKIPGHYYLFSNDLGSSTSSEEQQIILNNIINMPKLVSNERAFINTQTNSIQETYPYIYDGSTWQIFIPKVSNENKIKSSLLSIRSLVLRIAVVYEREAAIQMIFGSGYLITNNLLLTCAHIFDPILWGMNKISYSKILVGFCDLAPDKFFSLLNPDKIVFPAKILQRGLVRENIDEYTELKDTDTDLALLMLDNEIPNIIEDQYFNPKFDFKSKPDDIPTNSNLYLVGYNGELREQKDLVPYRYLEAFNNTTTFQLNHCHHVNYNTLPGSSGSIILNCYGRLVGVHIGISSSIKQKNNDIFFTKNTYDKYISINSNQFQTFIGETILPNINDDK
ncbi:unnamed protein product, partial [Rotaria magnacalcarata]